MTRRNGLTILAIAVALFVTCAGLVAWQLISKPSAPTPPGTASTPEAPEAPPPRGPVSTIIDLPGDPVLVRRGTTVAPKVLTIALPAKLAVGAPKVEAAASLVDAPLAPSNGAFMGKFPAVGEGADIADAALLDDRPQVSADASTVQAAGFDDDGGGATPASGQQAPLTDLDSSQLEVSVGRSGALPQIREAIIRTVVQERIRDLLIRNGFTEDSATGVEEAAKAAYNIQSLPPSSIAVAVGALDTAGAYRAVQLSIYENKEYVGAVALAEAGGYGLAAQPTAPTGLLGEGSGDLDVVRYDLADGVYSAGVRNNVPEPVIREGIQLLGKLTDLKAALLPGEDLRLIYAREFRGQSKVSGKIIYIGLAGSGLAVGCYSFQSPDGLFRCFDPRTGAAPPSAGAPAPAGAGVVFAPIRGAPITSTFGMRFHPILHILRLHAGIDFGAPVGSPVRAVADGKVEIAGPVSGFGNHVRLQHKGFETSYSHLSEIPASVVPGAAVTQGQTIALSGNTGLSTGPHLHFEYYLDRVAVDPLPHMGTEVAAAAPAGPTEQEIAAFATAKTIVDAALDPAAH